MPRTIDRAARLEEISQAVEAIARSDGFSAVTFRGIAERLGASTTVVTHLFGSRDELLDYVIDRSIARRCADIEAEIEDTVGGAAIRSIATAVVLNLDDDTHRFWLALVMGADLEPVVRKHLDRFNQWWDDLVFKHAKELAPNSDPEAVVDAINVIVTGLIVSGVETDALWSQQRRHAALDRLLAALDI